MGSNSTAELQKAMKEEKEQ